MGRKMRWMKTGAAMLTVMALSLAACGDAPAPAPSATAAPDAAQQEPAGTEPQEEPAPEPVGSYKDKFYFPIQAEQAVERMKGLGIMEDLPDGSFGEEQTLTRAEICKIAVIAAGLEETALNEPGDGSVFADVEPGHWAHGWITVAARQGYIIGDGDGKFRPDDTLTQSEALTVLLRTLGYDDELPGAWPQDYVAKAALMGVLDYLVFLADEPIIRAEVAVMTTEVLDLSKAE